MVALKLLSKDDVITAYLKSFGFQGERLVSLVATVSADLTSFSSDDGEVLIQKVDAILLKLARHVFPHSHLKNEQLLAQFKLCFLRAKGAEKCSPNDLKSLSLSKELIEEMRSLFVINAPLCHYLDMPDQSLDYSSSESAHD